MMLCWEKLGNRRRGHRGHMKIDYLRYLVEVERCGSLSKASKSLYISHQGLNKAISAMERKLGIRLIERSYEGVRLTREGQALAACARSVVSQYDTALIDIGAVLPTTSRAEKDAVNLLMTPYALSMLSSVLKGSSYGSIIECPFNEVVSRLLNLPFNDVAVIDVFSEGPLACEAESLGLTADRYRLVPLFKTKLGVLTKRDHALAQCSVVSIDEVASLPLALIRNDALRAVISKIFGKKGLRNVVLETVSSTLYVNHMNQGLAFGMLDSFAYWSTLTSNAIEDAAFVPLETIFDNTVCLAYSLDAPNAAALEAFSERFAQRFARACSDYFKAFPAEKPEWQTPSSPHSSTT